MKKCVELQVATKPCGSSIRLRRRRRLSAWMQAVMQLSLLWLLSLGSCTSGIAAPHVHGEQAEAALPASPAWRLVLGNDHDRGRPDRHARILVGRALDAARDHQPHVHAVVVMPLARERVVDRLRQLGAVQADVEHHRLRAFEQPVEVGVEEQRVAASHAQPLPDAVAEHEAAVEHRHHGLGPGLQRAIDPDPDVRRCADRRGSRGCSGPWRILGRSPEFSRKRPNSLTSSPENPYFRPSFQSQGGPGNRRLACDMSTTNRHR